jgi:hypothetical protein
MKGGWLLELNQHTSHSSVQVLACEFLHSSAFSFSLLLSTSSESVSEFAYMKGEPSTLIKTKNLARSIKCVPLLIMLLNSTCKVQQQKGEEL